MSDPFRKGRAVEPEVNPYGALGLRENPFPSEPTMVPGSADPRMNGSIYCEALHIDKQRILERMLVPTPQHRNPVSITFLMDHASRRGRGIGKTAFLKHQRDRIMSDFGEEASSGSVVLCAVHVLPPPQSRKFWEFCRVIVEALIEQNIISSAIWRLRAFTGAIPENVLSEAKEANNLDETIGNDTWLISRGIDVTFHLNGLVREKLRIAGVRNELANIFTVTQNSTELRERVFSTFRNVYWQREGGRVVFDDMVKLFLAAQFNRCLFLIDEVEKFVYYQNMNERRAFVESLRYYMLDADFANARNRFIGLLLTIHPGIQELLSSHWKAVGLDGIAPITEPEARENTIYFGPLDQKMAIPLVTVYLDYYRTRDSEKGTIMPFTKEAVTDALIKAQGVPRPMLRLLNRTIEHAAKEKMKRIGKEVIDAIYTTPEYFEAEVIIKEETLPSVGVDLSGEQESSGDRTS